MNSQLIISFFSFVPKIFSLFSFWKIVELIMNDSSSISLNDSCFLTSSISSTVLSYPVIFAQEAEFVNALSPMASQQQIRNAPRKLKTNGESIFPEFSAKLGADITLVGFNMTRQEALGQKSTGSYTFNNAGYYFALQERPGQLRFGADESGPATSEMITWDDLSWDIIDSSSIIKVDQVWEESPQVFTDQLDFINWGKSSADMAYILSQKPILFLVHSNNMILS